MVSRCVVVVVVVMVTCDVECCCDGADGRSVTSGSTSTEVRATVGVTHVDDDDAEEEGRWLLLVGSTNLLVHMVGDDVAIGKLVAGTNVGGEDAGVGGAVGQLTVS